METKLVVFKDKEIRRTLIDNEWYFAVVDDSVIPKGVELLEFPKDINKLD